MKRRKDWDIYYFRAFRRRRRKKRQLKRCIKKELSWGFFIQIALCKVRNRLEYRFMYRIIKRIAYRQVSEFHRGMFVAYREYGLPFDNTTHCTGRHPFTLMHIWNQWVAEGDKEQQADSQRLSTLKINTCLEVPIRLHVASCTLFWHRILHFILYMIW